MRVLLVAEPSMVGEGIEGLLRQEPGLEIVGRVTDPDQVVRYMQDDPPDVVILTDGEVATDIGAELLRMVREGFHMRIVEIHVATNTLGIYCGEQESMREVGDLVDALKRICHSLNGEAGAPLSPATGEPAA